MAFLSFFLWIYMKKNRRISNAQAIHVKYVCLPYSILLCFRRLVFRWNWIVACDIVKRFPTNIFNTNLFLSGHILGYIYLCAFSLYISLYFFFVYIKIQHFSASFLWFFLWRCENNIKCVFIRNFFTWHKYSVALFILWWWWWKKKCVWHNMHTIEC